MQEDMTNVAYTKEYLDMMEDVFFHLFDPSCYRGEERLELDSEISILQKHFVYEDKNEKYPCGLEGSKNIVFRNDKAIYSFNAMDDIWHFWTFAHQNGHEYLVFKRGLYGYSVLDLSTMRDYHYYPAGSFPDGETFIWTDVHYNPANNIMAVGGCYWACPYSIVLMDFSNPMGDAPQIDIGDLITKGHGCYGDIAFIAWEGTDLILKLNGPAGPAQQEDGRISSEEYMKWVDNKIR